MPPTLTEGDPQLPLGVRGSARVELAHYAAITDRDVFNAPRPPEPPVMREKVSLPPLRASLLGVAPSADGRAFAVIEDPTAKTQLLLYRGDFLQGRELIRVNRNVVVFKAETGQEETLELPLPPNTLRSGSFVREIDDGTPHYDRSGLLALMPPSSGPEYGAEVTEAFFAPEFRDGELTGIRISAILPNSVYHRSGFKNGDLIVSLDGKSFPSPLAGLQRLRSLGGQKAGRAELLRQGKPATLDLTSPAIHALASKQSESDEWAVPAWDWKAELPQKTRRDPPPASQDRARRHTSEIVVTDLRDVRRLNLWEESTVPVSTPGDWNQEELLSIPVLVAGELPRLEEPLEDPAAEPEPVLRVTDMRLVHQGVVDLDD